MSGYSKDLQTLTEVLLDKMPVLAAIVDINETYLTVNQPFADFHQKPKSGIVGKKIKEILPESSYQRVIFPLERVKMGEMITFENLIKGYNGQVYTFKVTYEPLLNEQGQVKAFTAIMEDVSEQKQTESELTRSFELIQKLLDVAPIGIVLMDATGIISYENPAMMKMMGVPEHVKSPVVGKRITELPPIIESGGVEIFNKVLEGGSVRHHELEFTSLFGRKTVLEIYGSSVYDRYNRLMGGILITIDITERKNIDKKLIHSEERFRKAFHSSPDAVNINRLDDGLYVDINEGFSNITGYSREDAIGKTSGELNIWVKPEDRARLVASLRAEGRISNLEAPFRMKSGEIRQGLMSAVVIDVDGIPHILSITRDIDEIKKIQAELLDAKEKAEESDRLKSAFLANMSHEIRTPMNSILGFSELLEDPDLDEDLREKYLRLIQKSGETLLALIHELMDIAKIESGQVTINDSTFSLNDLMRDTSTTMMAQAASKKLKMSYSCEIADGDDMIRTDRTMVSQILCNLLSNAIKFTSVGEIAFGYTLTEGYLRFWVSDTGRGIPQEHFTTVFERFRQVEDLATKKMEGAGLGLAICKSYIHLLGGKIWLSSTLDKGSTFYFTIPYAQ